MYIPIMKNRSEELKASINCNRFFSNNIIPLYEIVRESYIPKFKTNEAGDFLYETKPGNKQQTKIPLDKTVEDINTLMSINDVVNGKQTFIDFFRFFEDEYGKKTFDNIELSFAMSRNFSYYRKRLLEIKSFSNFIPTISLKNNLKISTFDLLSLVQEFKNIGRPVALRITDDLMDDYEEFIEHNLSSEDYVMLDLREKDLRSKTTELSEFEHLDFSGKKILLNSPRKKSIKNGDFNDLKFTPLIDNSAKIIYESFNLDGFGDFGGLKDDLPTKGGNGKGAALCLLYFKNNNQFFVIVNKDTLLGVKGYKYIKQQIEISRSFIDPHGNCIGIQKADSFPNGGFKEWNNVNLSRYIHQQHL